MFDFSWSEIALVGGVALVLIGPKDLPIAMRAVAGFVRKARGMASEFQGHVDEMLREADLTEARDTLRQMRRMDVRGRVLNLLDDDGSLRRSVRAATAPLPPLSASRSIGRTTPHDIDQASRIDDARSVGARSLGAGSVASGNDEAVIVASTAHSSASSSATAFAPGPYAGLEPPPLSAAPDAIPPGAARAILRRAAPRPDFLPPGPAY